MNTTRELTPEQLERENIIKAYHEKVAAVFALVGEGLTIPPYQRDENGLPPWRFFVRAPMPRRAHAFIFADSTEGNRLCFSAVFDFGTASSYGLTAPTVTVSAAKTAEQIAADLRRRLIPVAQAYWTEAGARRVEADDYRDKTARNLARLVPNKADRHQEDPSRDHSLNFPGSVYGTLRVSGDSVRLHLDSLTMDQAVKILAIVRRAPKED